LEEGLVTCRESGTLHQVSSALAGLGELAVRRGQYERAREFLGESLDITRRTQDTWLVAVALGSLGWVALRQRDFHEMRRLLGESLELRMETGDRGGMAWCLERLAEAADLEGQPEKAVRTFSAAATLRAPSGSIIDSIDQPEHDRILSGLRTALGQQAFDSLWAEGQAMALEGVVDYALSEPEESAARSASADKERFGGLTEREREVAGLIAQGKSNREIARAMTVGVKTIETYVTRILNKLGFDSRVQIATWAIEVGLYRK
jgi:DNA-binding CsgD family transcriptional regulator